MQQTERRGRGRERRERTSYRDDERSAKPPDSIRLFEFLQPQIGDKPKEEDNADYPDQDDYGGVEQEELPTWERDNVYHRPGHGRSGGEKPYTRGRGTYQDRDDSNTRGRRGSYRGRGGSYHNDSSYQDRRESYRGRGRPSHDDSYRTDNRESHRGRGSHQDRDWRGISAGTTFRGQGSSDQESYGGREQSFRDNRGSFRRGRGSRDIEDTYSNHRSSNRDHYPSSRSPVNALVEDFKAWPGLETKPAQLPVQVEIRSAAPKTQEQWAVEDYCLAKWESSDKVQ